MHIQRRTKYLPMKKTKKLNELLDFEGEWILSLSNRIHALPEMSRIFSSSSTSFMRRKYFCLLEGEN